MICFIIAGAFAASAVPGYTPGEIGGIAVIIVFLILGVISGVVGYFARPKATMLTTIQPRPTPLAPIQEKPKPEPIDDNIRVKGVVDKLGEQAPEPLPPAPPQEIPSPASELPPTEEVSSETLKPEQPASPQLEETAVAPPTETELTKVIEPTKAIEEEKPKEKRVRRRRKKTQ